MPMLKSISGHTPVKGAGHIEKYLLFGKEGESLSKDIGAKEFEGGVHDYLEKGERALGCDLFNFFPEPPHDAWGAVMDATRESFGNDISYNGKRAVTYQHFIISPDPKDKVSLEQLRELVARWVEEHFSDDDLSEPSDSEYTGRGVYQVAAVYHDDNANHIPHAHIVVNNTDLITGRRLHISRKENKVLANSLQAIAREMGLSYYDNVVTPTSRDLGQMPDMPRSKSRRYRTNAERDLSAKGVRLWKDDICDYITIAANLARKGTIEDFRLQLEALGVKTEFRDNGADLIYFHPDGGAKKVTGKRLGRICTVDGVKDQMRLAYYRRLVADDTDPIGIRELVSDVRSVRFDGEVDLQDITRAFMAIDTYKLETVADARKALSRVKATAPTKGSAPGLIEAWELNYENLTALLRVASHTDVLPKDDSTSSTKARKREEEKVRARIQEKVDNGWRLTREEYRMLTPRQIRAWNTNRHLTERQRELRKKHHGKSSSSKRGSTSTDSPRRNNQQRGGEGRSR